MKKTWCIFSFSCFLFIYRLISCELNVMIFSSHFSVFKVRPISWQYVDIEGNPVLYASHAYDVQYKVKVENVFKGQESLAKDGATIFLHSPKNLCLIDQLEMGIKYLISGKFTDITFFINLNCCQVEKKIC